MTMNTRFISRGPIIVAELLEVVAGEDVVVVSSKEPFGIHTPLIFVSPGSHLNRTLPMIECCRSSSFPINNCIN